MKKKICSILVAIILALIVAFIGYDQYNLHKTVEKSKIVQETGVNIVVKSNYDDGELHTTVKIENGWFKQWAYNFLFASELYGDDFIVVYYEDNDGNVIKKVEFSIKDFAQNRYENYVMAKKTVEISAKKRKKIKDINCSYKGLHVKEIIE
jgi:hypothetical protein